MFCLKWYVGEDEENNDLDNDREDDGLFTIEE